MQVVRGDDGTEMAQTCVVVKDLNATASPVDPPRLRLLQSNDDVRDAIAQLRARAARVKASDGDDSISFAAALLDLASVSEAQCAAVDSCDLVILALTRSGLCTCPGVLLAGGGS